MSRSFGAAMRQMAREAARAERERQRSAARQQTASLRAQRESLRQAKVDNKEAARLYTASRVDEAEQLTRELSDREEAIDRLLSNALKKNPKIELASELKIYHQGCFSEEAWTSKAPDPLRFALKEPGFLARLIPGSAGRYKLKVEEARKRFEQANLAHQERQDARAAALALFEKTEAARREEILLFNSSREEVHRALTAAEHGAVITYYRRVLNQSFGGEPDALAAEVGYSVESRHMVVDIELPEFSVIPEETAFKYVKAADRLDAVPRTLARRKALYASLISQISLKAVDTVFRGGVERIVECLTLNAMLDTVDPATGQQVRLCLLSVRVTADTFNALNLTQVQPEQCLRSLKASVSRAPTELLPVKPLVELDMVDPRFVETLDVLSSLDSRMNLMELSPIEFEGLITNLFAAMGLDTRQTRASRDGGVDCVAFDQRPIFGGKVVIQAKRYKNTVGVSAVRDLFGTVQNEGASKGILVTTSGYGKAAYDFAKGKPLELLDGANLLHLLAQHAGMDARIIMPEAWTDAPLHGE